MRRRRRRRRHRRLRGRGGQRHRAATATATAGAGARRRRQHAIGIVSRGDGQWGRPSSCIVRQRRRSAGIVSGGCGRSGPGCRRSARARDPRPSRIEKARWGHRLLRRRFRRPQPWDPRYRRRCGQWAGASRVKGRLLMVVVEGRRGGAPRTYRLGRHKRSGQEGYVHPLGNGGKRGANAVVHVGGEGQRLDGRRSCIEGGGGGGAGGSSPCHGRTSWCRRCCPCRCCCCCRRRNRRPPPPARWMVCLYRRRGRHKRKTRGRGRRRRRRGRPLQLCDGRRRRRPLVASPPVGRRPQRAVHGRRRCACRGRGWPCRWRGCGQR
ncbi:hypothetical protein I4F81_007899 [Pyropia yezoensis]|uniref:Uncharacterized protein n=1 Tax=Pyropia yezoensis TaxID=2788 RepID=A0ACC3C5C8_PYRYE|nr:hypothetical protein I4F81_007899 [Neopyropia yezoensis]